MDYLLAHINSNIHLTESKCFQINIIDDALGLILYLMFFVYITCVFLYVSIIVVFIAILFLDLFNWNTRHSYPLNKNTGICKYHNKFFVFLKYWFLANDLSVTFYNIYHLIYLFRKYQCIIVFLATILSIADGSGEWWNGIISKRSYHCYTVCSIVFPTIKIF